MALLIEKNNCELIITLKLSNRVNTNIFKWIENQELKTGLRGERRRISAPLVLLKLLEILGEGYILDEIEKETKGQ